MSINTTTERQRELMNVWETMGPAEAKRQCRNVSEKLAVEEISADYYLEEAKAVAQELAGNQDIYYLEEKIRHLVEMMDIATKHTPINERWMMAVNALRQNH